MQFSFPLSLFITFHRDDEEYWLRFTGVLEDDKAKPNKLDPTKLDIKILDTSKDRSP